VRCVSRRRKGLSGEIDHTGAADESAHPKSVHKHTIKKKHFENIKLTHYLECPDKEVSSSMLLYFASKGHTPLPQQPTGHGEDELQDVVCARLKLTR